MKFPIVLSTLLLSTTCYGATYIGGGGRSCNDYISNKAIKTQQDGWVLGYFSGVNISMPTDALNNDLITGDFVIGAVEKHCKNHLEDTLIHAANEIYFKLLEIAKANQK